MKLPKNLPPLVAPSFAFAFATPPAVRHALVGISLVLPAWIIIDRRQPAPEFGRHPLAVIPAVILAAAAGPRNRRSRVTFAADRRAA